MPAITFPVLTQTFDFVHAVNGLKNWPMMQSLDFQAAVNATDAPYAVEGRIAYIDPSTATYKLGCSGISMPHILLRSQTSFDVANNGGTAWQAGFPAGQMASLVATGAYEIETTEFDTTLATYTPNMVLKSPTISQITAGAGQANAGLLYNLKNWAGGGNGAMTAYTDTIVGLVSRGNSINNYNVPVLAFWPNPIYGTQ